MRNFILVLFLILSTSAFTAMTGESCATKIVAKIKVKNPEITGAAETQLKSYWVEICKGIIEEIQQNSVTTVPGITPGPGTTTGTIQ